jgi:hypothetical protein
MQLLTPVVWQQLHLPGPMADEWAVLHDAVLAEVIVRDGMGAALAAWSRLPGPGAIGGPRQALQPQDLAATAHVGVAGDGPAAAAPAALAAAGRLRRGATAPTLPSTVSSPCGDGSGPAIDGPQRVQLETRSLDPESCVRFSKGLAGECG